MIEFTESAKTLGGILGYFLVKKRVLLRKNVPSHICFIFILDIWHLF